MSVIIIKEINPYVNTVPVSAETPESIKAKLQSLQGEARLDKSAIKGLGLLGGPLVYADSVIDTSYKVMMLQTERDKLSTLNNTTYIHPSTHPAAMIVEDASNRFVSDAQIVVWDNKQDKLVSGQTIKTYNGQSILGAGDFGDPSSNIIIDPSPTSGSTNAVSSGGVYTSLQSKVDVVAGKGLSTNDYTTTDKTKLSTIMVGATVNSPDIYLLNRNNHTGTQSADTIIDGTTNKVFTTTDETKLNNIASGATQNSSDAFLLSRTNHTGSQTASTISDFQSTVSNNLNVAANTAARHTHSNKTILDAITASYTTSEQTKLGGVASGATANNTDAFLLNRTNHTGTQAISTIELLQTALDSKQASLGFTAENAANKGVANGYAPLGSDGKVASTFLPSGAIVYKGTWNASTNTPALSDATGTNGWEYNVAVGGTQNLGSGNITFVAGSYVIHNGSVWQQTVNSNTVASVNGYTGTVVLTKADVALGNVDNISAANLRDRTTHTGVQPTSTINFAASSKILGRNTTGAGVAEELSSVQVTSMLDVVTTTLKGLMSATDKTKLDGISSGATTNSADSFLLSRANHTGTQSADTIIDGTTNKVYSATDKTKLAGIAAGATANSTDSYLTNRSNHTGTQTSSTITLATSSKFVGRLTTGAGAAEELTGTQATTLLDVATTSLKGLLSSADKTKLDGIASNSTSNSSDSFLLNRTNHTGTQSIVTTTVSATSKIIGRISAGGGVSEELSGTQATSLLDVASTTLKGLLSSADKTKLDSVASGATLNSTDAFLLNRANHTGSQAISTIVNLQSTLDSKSAIGHTHLLSDITNVVVTTPVSGQVLKYNGTNWVNGTDLSGGGSTSTGDMLASTYDTNLNGIVDNSERLNNQLPSFYLSRANHTGTQSADTLIDGTTNKAFLATERTKLSGIAAGATVNSTDSFLLSRANHTGTEAITTNTFSINARIAGRITTGAGTAEELTGTQVTTLLDTFTVSAKGLVPAPVTSNTTDFLRRDGTWAAPPSTGGDMLISIYDPNNNGIVENAEKLNGQLPSYYLSRTNHTGSQNADTLIDGTTNKAFLATERTKLSGIQSGATVNSTDTFLLSRANHTGTQAISTIVNLQTTLDGKSPIGHTHVLANITDVVVTTPTTGQVLKYNGTNWVNGTDNSGTGGGTGDMQTLTYDTNANGVVDNSERLNGQLPAFYLARANHTGTQSADSLTDGTTNKAFLATERTKLTGIATGATANNTDAFLLSRTNHTGTQAATTIVEDSTHRFTSDAEKSVWNSKQAAGDYATNTTVATKVGSAGSPNTINNVWVGTQAQYNAIATPLATTLYFIQ